MQGSSSFTARSARPQDYPVFAGLFRELEANDPVPGVDDFARMMPRVIVLEADDVPIAYGFWRRLGPLAHVGQLVVHVDARGRGAGRAMMEAIRLDALREGCVSWDLNVKRSNLAAIRLYEQCGLRPQGEGWALRIRWAQVNDLCNARSEIKVFTPLPEDDFDICARLGTNAQRLAEFRQDSGRVFVALRERSGIVAFASVHVRNGRANPFCVDRSDLARPLLEAVQERGLAGAGNGVEVVVEDDEELVQVLRRAGAESFYETITMAGKLNELA